MMILIILPIDAALFIQKENTMHYTKLSGALILICMLNTVAAQTEATAPVETDSAAAETDSAETEAEDYQGLWSGFYTGFSLAANTLDADWTTTEVRTPDGVEEGFISDPRDSVGSSETAPGLYLGYNWELGRVVLGVEAYSQFFEHEASIEDRIPGLSHPEADPNSYVVVSAESDDSFGLRLRGGFLVTPELLLYATAGETSLEVSVTSICPVGDVDVCNDLLLEAPLVSTVSTTINTTAFSLGAEYASDGLQLRAEYQYADFGDFDFTAMRENFILNYGADATLSVMSRTIQLGVTLGF
jgi:opacity protein-like surface antigen